MKFCLIIQGEGRGHQMQAAALREILEDNGHEINRIFMGRSMQKNKCTDPDIQVDRFFLSPHFIITSDRRGVNLLMTFLINIFIVPAFLFESFRLAIYIRKIRPDIVINFYDIIGGICFLFLGKRIKRYVISHHFFFEHRDFRWPEDRKFERRLLLLHSKITSLAADKKLALSFTRSSDDESKKLYIIPPLLRKKVLGAVAGNNGHIHVYTLYPGYYRDLGEWCRQHPEQRIIYFSDFRNIPSVNIPNFKMNQLNGKAFIDSLILCNNVLCSAGFETLAEAAYLGKPLQVIPTESHFEQYCNAIDLERSGLGIRIPSIGNLSIIRERTNNVFNISFKEWVDEAGKIILGHL